MLSSSSNNRWEEVTASVTQPTSTTVRALATDFSPFGQGSGGEALPIDLVSFDASCNNSEVEVEFVVGSQVNNDYFTIKRSNNNTDWTVIGEIAGVGNTSSQMTYQWIDNDPLMGTSYYKLSQTDYDGTSKTFHSLAVKCEEYVIGGYNTYPNPVKDILMIDLELEVYQGDNIQLKLTDIKGQLVKSQAIQLSRGYNHLEMQLKTFQAEFTYFNLKGLRVTSNNTEL